jgi:hypothetical protein
MYSDNNQLIQLEIVTPQNFGTKESQKVLIKSGNFGNSATKVWHPSRQNDCSSSMREANQA